MVWVTKSFIFSFITTIQCRDESMIPAANGAVMKQVLQKGGLLGGVKVKDAGQLMVNDMERIKSRTATDMDLTLHNQGLY